MSLEPLKSTRTESVVLALDDTKQRITKKILSNAGMICSCFLFFVAAVVLTTDIKSIESITQIANLGVSFVVILFLTYSMYFSCSDSGIKSGKLSLIYAETCKRCDDMKNHIITNDLYKTLVKFCNDYIKRELKTARSELLSPVGISYEEYEKNCKGRDIEDLKATYSHAQLKAIKRANKLKAIRLTADMICKRSRRGTRRNPLGMNPGTKKTINDVLSFIKITLTSLLTGVVVLDAVVDFSWATIVGVLLKLMPVVVNAFNGYKSGYEYIVIDNVDYMNDQIDLMEQAVRYKEKSED